jgi:hypothetical protein
MTSLSRFFQGFRSGYRKQHAITVATETPPTGGQVKKRTSVIVICSVIGVLIVLSVALVIGDYGLSEDLARKIGGVIVALFSIVFFLRVLIGRRARR